MPGRKVSLHVVPISIGLAITGLALVGLPGALVLQAATVLTGFVSSAQLGGDQAWPAALAISAVGPFTLIPADLMVRRMPLPQWSRAVLASALALAVTLAATVVGIVVAGQ